MRTFLAAIACTIALASTAGAGDGSRPTSAPSVAPAPDLPSVAARFETGMTTRASKRAEKADWYFLREASRVETVRPAGGLAEVWERDERGELSLKRVFHADRRIVEYMPGDLRARGAAVSWATVASVIDPHLLAQLRRTGTAKTPQGAAEVYRGSLDGEHIEVWWLAGLVLPARVVRESGERRFTLALKTLHAAPPGDWPRVEEAGLTEYLVIDVADFGDMHNDAFVRQVERLDAEARAFRRPALHSH